MVEVEPRGAQILTTSCALELIRELVGIPCSPGSEARHAPSVTRLRWSLNNNQLAQRARHQCLAANEFIPF